MSLTTEAAVTIQGKARTTIATTSNMISSRVLKRCGSDFHVSLTQTGFGYQQAELFSSDTLLTSSTINLRRSLTIVWSSKRENCGTDKMPATA